MSCTVEDLYKALDELKSFEDRHGTEDDATFLKSLLAEYGTRRVMIGVIDPGLPYIWYFTETRPAIEFQPQNVLLFALMFGPISIKLIEVTMSDLQSRFDAYKSVEIYGYFLTYAEEHLSMSLLMFKTLDQWQKHLNVKTVRERIHAYNKPEKKK
jgi:hypothetical protein